MSDSQKFDVVVVGGGPAGYVAAIRAAQLGFKAAVVEKEALGGTCLNVGCIPSKALLASSEHYRFIKNHAIQHGIVADGVRLDLAAMLRRKDNVVSSLVGGIGGLMRKNKITVFKGRGKIPAAGKVEVANSDGEIQSLESERIIIATGSVSSTLPSLPLDGRNIVTSTEAIAFDTVPKRLVVVGAGAIGLELGSVWARLGSQVTVIEFLPRIAPGSDIDLANGLKKSLESLGMEFHLKTGVTGADLHSEGIRVNAKSGDEEKSFEADKVLLSIGRKPNFEGLFENDFSVKTDDRGRIVTNERFETSVKGVYAIGDVIAGPMLAHKAEEEGVALAEMLAGKAGHVNYKVIPNVIYTHPELASVGLTEEEAREGGREVKVGKFSMMANGRSIANGDREGMVKIIADAKTDRILGVHILAAAASELIAEAVTAMEFHASSEDLARTVHAHPTVSEAVKEAALGVDGRMLHS